MYINHITLVPQKRLRPETFVLSESTRARGKNPLPPARFATLILLIFFREVRSHKFRLENSRCTSF